MGRPRSYEQHDVVDAAKHAFWENGYEGTALSDLEQATGLSRSSLYLAFGAKRGLFEASLSDYMISFIGPRLAPVEAPGAGLREAAGFFSSLAELFGDRQYQRGCLMINSIAERAGVDPAMEAQGAQFVTRLRRAFSNGLHNAAAQGAMSHRQATSRAEFLTAAALGVWLAVRVDPSAAVVTCRATATEIKSWEPPRPTGRSGSQAQSH